MYLFGGKFCKFIEPSRERDCTCAEILMSHPLCECDRKHFNNILWSTVTVFQVNIFRVKATRRPRFSGTVQGLTQLSLVFPRFAFFNNNYTV